MQITARELSQILQGEVEGNPDVWVDHPSKIEEGDAGSISFLANPKYESYAYTTEASILLVSKDFKPAQKVKATLIRVDNVYTSVAMLLSKFDQTPSSNHSGISAKASVNPDAQIAENVSIGDFAVVSSGVRIGKGTRIYPQVFLGENVVVGSGCTIFPGVRILHGSIIGNNCTIHPNAVLGADGFGFARDANGTYMKIAQIGNVLLEDDVEIGAGTSIDRATMGSTIIRHGVKIDNLVQVGHNVEIGENTVIAGQAGIAGSTKIGKNCMIGGQVGFAGHISIADGVKIGAQAGVTNHVKEPDTEILGAPAIPVRDFLKSAIIFKKLPELHRRLGELEKLIQQQIKS
jgi:UDP-3-O-[3-hydroxymyristoyl] glucosamine N-acyltransferase